jgi:hypothetical protein
VEDEEYGLTFEEEKILIRLLAERLRLRLGAVAARALEHFEQDYFDVKIQARQACQRADASELSDASLVSSSAGSSDVHAQAVAQMRAVERPRSGVDRANEPRNTYPPTAASNGQHPTSNAGGRSSSSRTSHNTGLHGHNSQAFNQYSQAHQLAVFGQQTGHATHQGQLYAATQPQDTVFSQTFPTRQAQAQYNYPQQPANPNPFSTAFSPPYGQWPPPGGQ